jgi:hypothetical protein
VSFAEFIISNKFVGAAVHFQIDDRASSLRIEHETLSIHYEFSEGRLGLLTLMLK